MIMGRANDNFSGKVIVEKCFIQKNHYTRYKTTKKVKLSQHLRVEQNDHWTPNVKLSILEWGNEEGKVNLLPELKEN